MGEKKRGNLLWRIVPATTWRKCDNPRKLSVRITGFRAENWNQNLPNKQQQCYGLTPYVQYHIAKTCLRGLSSIKIHLQ